MPIDFEKVIVEIRKILRESSVLNYVDDTAIDLVPSLTLYLESLPQLIRTIRGYAIALSPTDEGHFVKEALLGGFFRKFYSIDVGIVIKTGSLPTSRMLDGSLRANKGAFEFAQDIEAVLEHSTLSDTMDNYPGTNFSDWRTIATDDKNTTVLSTTYTARKTET